MPEDIPTSEGPLALLDKIPAVWRHLIILAVVSPIALLIVTVCAAIVTGGGFALDWAAELTKAGNIAVVSAAGGISGWVLLYITPLTRQYGVGSK
jgi:hypothetical protein